MDDDNSVLLLLQKKNNKKKGFLIWRKIRIYCIRIYIELRTGYYWIFFPTSLTSHIFAKEVFIKIVSYHLFRESIS